MSPEEIKETARAAFLTGDQVRSRQRLVHRAALGDLVVVGAIGISCCAYSSFKSARAHHSLHQSHKELHRGVVDVNLPPTLALFLGYRDAKPPSGTEDRTWANVLLADGRTVWVRERFFVARLLA